MCAHLEPSKSLYLRRIRACAVFSVLLVMAAAISACGGGGGGGGGGGDGAGGGTAPSISNLTVSPYGAYLNSGQGQATVGGSFDYVAQTSALATLTLRIKDASGNVIDTQTAPIQGAAAGTRGSIPGNVQVSTTTLGRYAFEVFVTDTAGRQSNVLTGSFRISDFPWRTLTGMPTPRTQTAVAVLGSKFYVIGGALTASPTIPAPAVANVEVYDAVTGAWSVLAPLPVATLDGVAVGINGRVYLLGGRSTPYSCSQITHVYVYDPTSGLWSMLGPIPVAVYAASTTVVGGKAYVFGGEAAGVCPDVIVPDVRIYDPASDAWSPAAAMPAALAASGSGAVGGVIAVFGGSRGNDDSSAVFAFDPAANAWQTKASNLAHPQGWSSMGYATVGNSIYSFGGKVFGAALSDVSAYDPVQDRWSVRESLATPLAGVGAGTYGGQVYLFAPDATLVYNPADDLNQ